VPEPVPVQRRDPQAPRDGHADLKTAGLAGLGPELPLEFRARLAQRDREALERFYEIYFDRVYGYIKRMLGEDHLAEDVTQDVFMHIQRSIHTYDPAREPGPWVFTIATNKVRDFWRSRRHKDAQLETSLDDDDKPFRPPSKERGPLPSLENEELAGELSRAIDTLSPGTRETLILRYFEGLSFEEIGAKIGRNETAVRKRYSRALADLREALERYVSPGEAPRDVPANSPGNPPGNPSNREVRR
jgi:RNA polymerase sigma-70 factor (ECF subfamily)